MKTKLYHGSVRKITGEALLPKQPQDLEERPENLVKGVYATSNKEIAIAMAIISCKGVVWAGLKFSKKPFGRIYEGWPEQESIYLYTLPRKTFKKSGDSGKQFVSEKQVKPVKEEKLKVEDCLYLVRKATNEEIAKKKEQYSKKYDWAREKR